MSDATTKPRTLRRVRSIYQVHYGLPKIERETARPLVMPFDSVEIQAYEKQVAGHRESSDARFLGLLQCNNGTILKPIIKECQRREIDFYERLSTTKDPDLIELGTLVPKYYGCRRFTYNTHEQEYIILEDVVQRMLEPCIMDVKIGRRTWDHLASVEKIQKEQTKYKLCKEAYGFCIPGFQVYRLSTGKLLKYNKDYGKRLHGQAVKEAIRNFLNGVGTSLCRALILQFLTTLWKIQKWASRQTSVKIYSCSLLLAYDAAKLRDCCGEGDVLSPRPKCRSESVGRRKSIHSMHSDTGSNFSGQISSKGPVYKKVNSVPLTSMQLAQRSFSPPPTVTSPWSEALEKINHNHSFDHNYEDKLSKIRMNYRAILDQLSGDSPNPAQWGTVKIIDFAHAFFNEEDEMAVDENFRDGIDSFVEIFEAFLKETDDQVF
ncbi:inositol polyphosphate multikinase isoform X1 [Cydia splendana]|uniref:inositol polyphosphate multikinase isoform X1 n=2 Tax=Cydia splendana TaxID=1100963 RepID=UPI0028F49C7D